MLLLIQHKNRQIAALITAVFVFTVCSRSWWDRSNENLDESLILVVVRGDCLWCGVVCGNV